MCSLIPAQGLLDPECLFPHLSHSDSADVPCPLSVGSVQAQPASVGTTETGGWLEENVK